MSGVSTKNRYLYGGEKNDFQGKENSNYERVSVLTARIQELTEHLKANPKDHHSRRGMLKLVGQRRGLLEYLKKKDIERYRVLIERLGLRK